MGITDTANWRAVYEDGSILNERDPDGKEHAFKEINLPNLKYFQLVNPQNVVICQARLGEGKRLIWARRNQMTTGRRMIQQGNVKVPIPIKSHQRIIIIGWQKTINGINTKAIFYLMPDGRIEMDDQWRDDSSLYDKVNTPGLKADEVKSTKPTKIVDSEEPKAEAYSGSNDSAFENKS